MPIRLDRVVAVAPWIVAGLVIAPGLCAQAPPEDQAPEETSADSLQLVFEREVFNYPAFERRDPFQPLTGDEASGPRFEDIVLLGVMLDPNPQESIAILGARPPGSTVNQPANRTYRLRMGESLGNMRLLDVGRREVLVEVADFGVRDTRRLSMRRPAPPPPSAPLNGPVDVPPDAAPPPEATPADSASVGDPSADLEAGKARPHAARPIGAGTTETWA